MKLNLITFSMLTVAAALTLGCTSDHLSLSGIERSQPTPMPVLTTVSTKEVASMKTDQKQKTVERKPVFKSLGKKEDLMVHVNGAPGVILIDFYADWCGPCRKQSSILHDLKMTAANKKASVLKIDVDDHSELAEKFKVSALPTLILIKNGKILERHVGLASQSKIETLISR